VSATNSRERKQPRYPAVFHDPGGYKNIFRMSNTSIIYKALSEIYEQPVTRSKNRSLSPFSSIVGSRTSVAINGHSRTSVASENRTSVAINNHRRTSVASDNRRSISSRAQSVALLSSSTSSTRAGHSPLLNTKSPSFSYTRRSQSGNLLAVGPSNYKIIGFENDFDSSLKSPLPRREGLSSSSPLSQSILTSLQSPYNVTALPFTDKNVPVQIASSDDESDNSPFIDEAAQLRSLVEETLALADTHFSPSGRGLNHGSTFPKYNKVILQDNSDTLSSGAQDILSLLATIHGGQNDEETQRPSAIESNHTALQESLVSINPDSILPSVDVDDVLNDDEEKYMLMGQEKRRN